MKIASRAAFNADRQSFLVARGKRSERWMARLLKEEWKVHATWLAKCRKRAKEHAGKHAESVLATFALMFWRNASKAWLSCYKNAAWCRREIRPSKAPFYIASFGALTAIFIACSEDWQPWIELLNGATWPQAASPPRQSLALISSPPTDAATASRIVTNSANVPTYLRSTVLGNLVFNMVLALRTMVNLGGLIGIVALVLTYRLKKEVRMYSVGLMNIMHIRDMWMSTNIANAIKEDPTLPENEDKFEAKVESLGLDFDQNSLPNLVGPDGMKNIEETKILVD